MKIYFGIYKFIYLIFRRCIATVYIKLMKTNILKMNRCQSKSITFNKIILESMKSMNSQSKSINSMKTNCHSPTQPQLELELDLIMGRKPPPHPHRNF